MDLIQKGHQLLLLAGGSIPGDKRPLDDSEKWGVTLAGMGIVLAALVLLVIIIFIFGKIFDSINSTNRQKAAKKAAEKAPKPSPSPLKSPAPAPKPAAAPAPVVPETDDDEVIAVISAVVAMMSAADGTTYQVKSVKPVQNGLTGRTAWAMDGRRNNVSPF